MDYAIGDVHGCSEELKELLAILPLQEGDRIIFLGDLVHKGPDSAGVIETVSKLQETHECIVITGNHDLGQLRWKFQGKGYYGAEKQGATLSEEHYETLLGSYLWYRTEHGFYVHAGILPSFEPLDKPITAQEFLALSNAEQRPLRSTYRIRFVRHDHTEIYWREAQKHPELVLGCWTDVYDGRFGLVIYGHKAYPVIRQQNSTVGTDTGCCYGGKLSAVAIANHEVQATYEVPALATYAQSIR